VKIELEYVVRSVKVLPRHDYSLIVSRIDPGEQRSLCKNSHYGGGQFAAIPDYYPAIS
jgi:hypothetical protein